MSEKHPGRGFNLHPNERQVIADQVKQAAEKYLDTENYVLAVEGKT
jgi:hypothetical protein